MRRKKKGGNENKMKQIGKERERKKRKMPSRRKERREKVENDKGIRRKRGRG